MSAVSALTVVRRASRKFIMETPRAMTTLRHFSDGSSPEAKLSSPKLQELYGDITKLREEDVNMLGAIVLKMLGRKLFPGEFGRGLEGLEFAAAPVLEEEEEKEEQTAFAVKLMGFDTKAKIKVIKEVRAIAGLGLKEAKELVESAPKVISKDLKKDKADELKAQLEAVGAQIDIE